MFFLSQRINRRLQWSVSTPSGTQSPCKNSNHWLRGDVEQVFVHDLNQTVMPSHLFPKETGNNIWKNVDSKRELFSCISKRQATDGADKQKAKYWYENTRGWHTYMYISAPGPWSISGSQTSSYTNSWQWNCYSRVAWDACRIMDWVW